MQGKMLWMGWEKEYEISNGVVDMQIDDDDL